jgi:hypothetical protein
MRWSARVHEAARCRAMTVGRPGPVHSCVVEVVEAD